MNPFFKWSGGKRKELKNIKAYMPDGFHTYYEPFLGGGALWLDLCPARSVVNDSYDDVMDFYKVLGTQTDALKDIINGLSQTYGAAIKGVKKDPKLESRLAGLNGSVGALSAFRDEVGDLFKVVSRVTGGEDPLTTTLEKYKTEQRNVKKELNKEIYKLADKFYYYYRDNEFESDLENAVRFYMLRQLSFSGMLRFAADGKFNVPYGWYKSFKGITENTQDIQDLFGRTEFRCMHWKDAVKDAGPNDFIFLDPPYTRTFKKYHVDGEFNQPEHEELAEWFKTTKSKAMIIINRDEFTSNLYGEYEKETHDKAYNIRYRKDRMKEKDINAVHLIATNYDVNP
jgi:DNA adenine methylase|tara:strand:- start:1043 stop:2065 length:1023 start_codon:yes stop_codon:yes gene_type:complete